MQSCNITDSPDNPYGIFIQTDKSVYEKIIGGQSDTIRFIFSNYTDSLIYFFNPVYVLEIKENNQWKFVSHTDIESTKTPMPGESILFPAYLEYMNIPKTDTFRSICEYLLMNDNRYHHIYSNPYIVNVDTLNE